RRGRHDGAGALPRAGGQSGTREARQRLRLCGAGCRRGCVRAGGPQGPVARTQPRGGDADGEPAPRPGPLCPDGFRAGNGAPGPLWHAVRQPAGLAARHFARRCPLHGPPLGCAAVTGTGMRVKDVIVIALGGNAVAPSGERPTIANQFRHTRQSLAPIVELAAAGWNIVLVHGNGPQVGDELARNEIAGDQVEPLPLGVLVAGTAGWMGYMIQQSLQNALERASVQRSVVTLITQTLCRADDPDLLAPSKPVGHKLDPTRAARLAARGIPVRDGRRLAPSPRPVGIVESQMVHDLSVAGYIVIAGGGGGPPVFRDPKLGLEGIDAVADKDRVAAILGREIGAQVLLILTNVKAVYRAYGTPRQEAIRKLTLAQADHLLAGKELGTGSMRPKVEAAADFVRTGGGSAIIADLAQGLAALQ